MKRYNASVIAEILHLPSPVNPDAVIEKLLTDSRSLCEPEVSIFFAISTTSNDGHRFIPELYDAGVRNFVVERMNEYTGAKTDANFFVVPDSRRALQSIARHHRDNFDIPVIAITGSRGKTTVKEWLYRLLQDDYKIVRSPRSYNSQTGVPLSIWEMDDDTDIAIFEAGISQPGEMAALESIIKPSIGIITNIGTEHQEGFSSISEKCAEKVMLLRQCDCIVYNADDPLIATTVANSALPSKEIAWSRRDADRPLFIRSIDIHDADSVISYSFIGVENEVTIPFTADKDIENAIHCLAVMHYLNRPVQDITARMKRLTSIGTRMDVIEGVNDCLVIHDSYTSDLNSLSPALDFMERHVTAMHSRTVILSDLMHETLSSYELYKAVAKLLKERHIDRVIAIGPEICHNARFFDVNTTFYPSTEAFLANMTQSDFDHELILIKGAPDFKFERINDMLEGRQHETMLEVNLDAIVHNYNLYRSKIKPETGIVCMVKASGYGAGAYELAKTLQSQHAAYLSVAAMDEGIDLRKAGITMPIIVLNPKVVNYRTLFAYNLEPEIYSFDVLNRIITEAEKCDIKHYPVHIKLDTGMHRLGFLEEDMPELISILLSQDAIIPRSVFSHLAAADDPEMDEYTMMQFDYFKRCSDMLQSGFNHHILRHILNSTGITRFPEMQYDMVRLGICLYGIKTMHDGSQDNLRPVSSLHSVIISIKEWEAGTTIGYNRRGVLTRHSRIATVPIGYADGLDRHLSNGNTSMMVNGHRCPTVGNICMDICMIDVTDVECKVGDTVEIFGDNIPVEELSSTLKTIPYEILTSISSRVKRVYYHE